MQYKNILSFDMEWNYKTIGMFAVLLLLPNLLGMINFSTAFGFKIHIFQIAIFFAAFIYGPVGGMMSGLFGSAYSALIMGNPYLAIGNGILGFCVGIFARYGIHTVLAVLLAFTIQLPWLILTDYYFINMPLLTIGMLVLALLISNTLWAFVSHYTYKPLKKALRI